MKENNMNESSVSQLSGTALAELFESGLQRMLWAETQLIPALQEMVENASSPALKEALTTHLMETKKQVDKVQLVFSLIGKSVASKECEAMAGLLKAGRTVMLETANGPQRDAAIIASAQKVEHYEMASYGSLTAFAKTLKMEDAAITLGGILQEEKNADTLLNELALSEINEAAAC